MGVAAAMSPLVSEVLTSTGDVQSSVAVPVTVAGAGYVTGLTVVATTGVTATAEIRNDDATGKVLLGPMRWFGNGGPAVVHLPVSSWVRYTAGIHATIVGATAEVVVHYKPD